MILRPILPAIVLLLLSAPTAAAENQTDNVVLIHVTSSLDKNTERTALVFRVVAGALKKGQRVVLYFDAEGVSSLRWADGSAATRRRLILLVQGGSARRAVWRYSSRLLSSR